MNNQSEFVIMDSCPITGFKLISNGQLEREGGRGKAHSLQNRGAYMREWNKKNAARIKEKNRLNYQAKKQNKNKV